ncbi:hypothetical protein DIE06_09140 [Burkholderia sp. Bp8998]|nr:hypothetical protein DIE06_09140 [Burkholderia sp. Bp8998]
MASAAGIDVLMSDCTDAVSTLVAFWQTVALSVASAASADACDASNALPFEANVAKLFSSG